MSKVAKSVLDIALALLALVLCLPLLAAIAAAIAFESRGGILFVQDRLGHRGRVFQMFKFRTMIPDAEQMGTGLFSYEGDSRITRVGRWLRRTSLDELPQLINVLRGEMSMVGPRPAVTYELGEWKNFSERLRARFDVNPGITGLAQVSGRNELTWDEKIDLDLAYISTFRRWGVFYDLVLLIRTMVVVLSMRKVVEPER